MQATLLRRRMIRQLTGLLPDSVLVPIKRSVELRLLRSVTPHYQPEFLLIGRLLQRGGNAIDIGANLGAYTKYMAELVGDAGTVYSIEPIAMTYDILAANLRSIGLTNAVPIRAAISDVDGEVEMEVPLSGRQSAWRENFCRARISDRIDRADGLRRERVRSVTLDGLVSELPSSISFVKCDVEGAELQVIQGATVVMRSIRPSWLIEISSDPNIPASPADQILTRFRQEDYQCLWMAGTTVHRWQPGQRGLDYFFVPTEQLRWLTDVVS